MQRRDEQWPRRQAIPIKVTPQAERVEVLLRRRREMLNAIRAQRALIAELENPRTRGGPISRGSFGGPGGGLWQPIFGLKALC